MSNNKQSSSVEWLIGQFKQYDFAHSNLEYYDLKIPMHIFKNITEQAKAMQQEQAQQYAEFCVVSDRQGLPLLDFNSWIAHNETFGE